MRRELWGNQDQQGLGEGRKPSLKASCWRAPNTLSACGGPLKLGLVSIFTTSLWTPLGKAFDGSILPGKALREKCSTQVTSADQ